MIGKHKLVFDPTAANDTDNVGAYVRANDGTLITKHTVGNATASVVFQGITFTADNAGTAGNSISLVFDGNDDVATVVGAWNGANPSNTVSYTGLGTVVPTAGTATLAGGTDSHGLDMWILNESIEVTATDLDIRDLTQADEVTVFQGTDPWVVSATDLDIRDLDFATDSIDVSGSEVSLDAATLAALETITVEQGTSPWVVSATDLDIRDITHVSDSIRIGDGTDFLAVNADGSINVNADISVVTGHEKAEDAAHASEDIGSYVLAVRQDVLASSTSADGDYASFKVNEDGALWVQLADSQVEVPPPTYTGWLVSQNTVDASAELIVAADLTDRRRILIQNNSTNRILYLGHSNSVSSANGIVLHPGSTIEMDLSAGVAIYAIASGVGADIRVAEFAAA